MDDAGLTFSSRESTAPSPQSSKYRGAAAARSGRHLAWVTQSTDVFGDFTARQLAAFARFRTLRHFDLNLIGAGEVFRRSPKRPDATCLIFERSESPFHRDVDQYAVFTDDIGNGLAVLNAR